MSGEAPNLLLIFDGVCSLCSGVVKFIIARDPDCKFKFAALQSKAAAPYLLENNITQEDALKSFVFIEDGTVYRKSAAALRIAAHLGGGYEWLAYFGGCVPTFIRDSVYDIVATNRYRVFGKEDVSDCLPPFKHILKRFLDAEEIRDRNRTKSKSKDVQEPDVNKVD